MTSVEKSDLKTTMPPSRPSDLLVGGIIGVAVLGAGLVTGALDGPAFLVLTGLFSAGLAIWARVARPAIEVDVAPPAEDELLNSLLPPVSTLIEKLPDPFLLLDGSGRVLLSNGSTHPLFEGAEYRRHVSGFLRAPPVLEAVESVLAGAGAQDVEYSHQVPVERYFVAHIGPVLLPSSDASPAASGQENGVLVVVRELTAQMRVEQMRADFVANASHELRTPLASLSGFIETLKGHARDDQEARERFLDIMAEQASRMRRLIEDLLSLSRIELNEHVRPETIVRLDEVVCDVVDGLMPQADTRDMKIDLHVGAPGPVWGDRDELYQVVQNLVDNALKYGSNGDRIEVSITESASIGGDAAPELLLRVRDFGEGIAREHIPRLTERFYRVDVQTSRQKGGTGLGLAIVKHIVNRHRGKLTIESQVGEGATFSIRFPLADNQAS